MRVVRVLSGTELSIAQTVFGKSVIDLKIPFDFFHPEAAVKMVKNQNKKNITGLSGSRS